MDLSKIKEYGATEKIRTYGFFSAVYILYIILSIATIIMIGILLRYGDQNKALLWIIFAVNILVFIAAATLMATDYKLWAGIVLLLQTVISGIILLYTNSLGNLHSFIPEDQPLIDTQYSASWILTVVTFIVGIVAIVIKPSFAGLLTYR
jgi:hypothetical protein